MPSLFNGDRLSPTTAAAVVVDFWYSGSMNRRPHAAATLAPAGLTVLVVVADLLSGRAIVYELLCSVPLLASLLDRPRRVLAWGLLAVGLEAALGLRDGAYSPAGALTAQAFRLVFTMGTTAAAMLLSSRRIATLTHLERLTEVALTAQQAVLRPLPAVVGPCRVSVSYQAAAAEAQIGGDLYGAVPRADGSGLFLVGDVRGKGLPAVRLAADVLGAFHYLAGTGCPPSELLAGMDRAVERSAGPEDFVTAVLVHAVRDAPWTLYNAGHPPPLVMSCGAARLLEPTVPSLPLGLGADPMPQTLRLAPAGRLLLYTDGLSEARRPADGSFFPLAAAAAPALAIERPAEALAALLGSAVRWTGDLLNDDAALMLLEARTA